MEEIINEKTVEEYLNSTDYKVDPSYVPSLFALNFVNFIKLVNGTEGESHKTPAIHFKMLDTLVAGDDLDVINMCHRGVAKALSLTTQIITPNGTVMMEQLEVGDEIYTRKGTITKVTHKSEVFLKPMFEIELEDGRKLEVSEDHLNIVLKRLSGKRTVGGFKEHVLTTNDLVAKGVTYSRKVTDRTPTGYESKWYVPTTELVEYVAKDIPIDPYTVGCILGDGAIDKNTGFTRLHTHADDLEHFLANTEGACVDSVRADLRSESNMRFSLKGLGSKVKAFIGTENVYSKRIPQELLWSSSEHRLATLRGLMDTDGTVYNNSSSYCTVSPGLANDVLWLARSLGFEAKVGKSEGYFRVYIYADICPFLLPRKVKRWKANKKGMVGIKSITPMELVESQCIAVEDESHSFLAESFFVTHNTTLMGEYLFLYLAVYGELPNFGTIPLAIYVSDSIENGVKNMRKNLEFRWENSDFLQEMIPNIRFTDIRWEFNNIDGKRFIVKGYGAKTGVRGAKEMGIRPVLAVLDDLISDEDARSVTVISAVEDTVDKAVEYALDPERKKVIWSGTPFNAKDPLYKAVESGAYAVNVFPVCERFPCTEEEFLGSWPDRFAYKYVKAQYDKAFKKGRVDTFNQELMLRIMSEEDRLIRDSDIMWYKRESVTRNKNKFNFYITTDFATSEKTSADFSVISVWALNYNGDWFWVDGIVKRQLMDANIDDLFRLAQIYKPQSVGVEVSGQQGGFISWIRNEMQDRHQYFTLASENNKGAEGIRPNTNKMQRFNIVVPLFKSHKIFLPLDMKSSVQMKEAVEELSLASPGGFKSKHDDWIDTASMLGSLATWRPSEEASFSKDGGSSDIWELDEDDMSSGSMDSYIY